MNDPTEAGSAADREHRAQGTEGRTSDGADLGDEETTREDEGLVDDLDYDQWYYRDNAEDEDQAPSEEEVPYEAGDGAFHSAAPLAAHESRDWKDLGRERAAIFVIGAVVGACVLRACVVHDGDA